MPLHGPSIKQITQSELPDCETLHQQLSSTYENLAQTKESLRQTAVELQLLPESEQEGPGSVGEGMLEEMAAYQGVIEQLEHGRDRLCEQAAEMGCPCRNLKRILVVTAVGAVGLVGILWLVRR